MCLLQLQGGFAHPRTSAWPGSARAPPQRVEKAITHLSLKSIVVSGALCWDCCCCHVQAASPGWRQSPFLAVGGKVRFPPGMVQQRRRMLVLGAAGPQSCGFAPAPLSAPLHALLEKGGGFSSPPFVEQLTLNHCLFPHQECFPTSWCSTQALLIDGSPFPQHVLSAESLLLFRFHPEEKLPQPSSSVSCEPSSAPQDNAAHHIGFLCYIRRHLPASSLKKHFSIHFSLVS